jgi:hypothetical protein
MRWHRLVAAGLAGAVGWLNQELPPDLADFATLGDRLLGGQLAAVYAPAWNQAGPVQLLVSRALLIGGEDGMPARRLLAAVDAALVLGAMALCPRLSGDRGPALLRREVAVAVLGLLWLTAALPWNGHPAELAVPLCWTLAPALLRGGHLLGAAAVLALAVAVAPWAVLGMPGLLVAGARPALRAATVAALLGAACYLPFVLTGRFAMFQRHWAVADGTLAHLAGLHQVTWWLRLSQAAAVAGGCAVVAWRYRDQPVVIAVAPLTAALLRVATDPLTFTYYWYPVGVAGVLVLTLLPAGAEPLCWAAALTGAYLAVLAVALGLPVVGASACLALTLAVVRPGSYAILRDGRRRSHAGRRSWS